jgi:hypothetical protein
MIAFDSILRGGQRRDDSIFECRDELRPLAEMEKRGGQSFVESRSRLDAERRATEAAADDVF